MGHILCYLQRTPTGLHPASVLSLCLARDFASQRGATVIGLAAGDGTEGDDTVVRQASRYGADQLVFVGARGLTSARDRLRPLHFIAPCSVEGNAVLEAAGLSTPAPSWLCGRPPNTGALDTVVSVVAGGAPWRDLTDAVAYAEYEEDYREASDRSWVPTRRDDTSAKLVYVAPQDLDGETKQALAACGATRVSPGSAHDLMDGTLLWLDAGPAGLPEAVDTRGASARVLLLPGPMAQVQKSWARADWVLPGAWPEATARLQAEPWRTALTA
ncbi:MAG: hypothetical protein V3V08_20960 [Nannocystaceae bacterium]